MASNMDCAASDDRRQADYLVIVDDESDFEGNDAPPPYAPLYADVPVPSGTRARLQQHLATALAQPRVSATAAPAPASGTAAPALAPAPAPAPASGAPSVSPADAMMRAIRENNGQEFVRLISYAIGAVRIGLSKHGSYSHNIELALFAHRSQPAFAAAHEVMRRQIYYPGSVLFRYLHDVVRDPSIFCRLLDSSFMTQRYTDPGAGNTMYAARKVMALEARAQLLCVPVIDHGLQMVGRGPSLTVFEHNIVSLFIDRIPALVYGYVTVNYVPPGVNP